MILAHKIQLDPNDRQRTYFARACGTARFAWNWALGEWNRQYAAGGKPNANALRRQLNAEKRHKFPWMLEVTKSAPEEAIRHLGQSFVRFFGGTSCRPRFKKKGVHESFSVRTDRLKCEGRTVYVSGLGWVRTRERLRLAGKILMASISCTAGRWFISIAVEFDHVPPARKNQAAVGVDLGVKNLATLSTGEVVAGPKPHRALLNRLRRLSRSLSRKKKGGRNRAKAKTKLARLHARIANIRRDSLHKLTTGLVRRFGVVGIESLNVGGMRANRGLSRAAGDMGFFEFRRQLEYKAPMHGSRAVVADRWFPSSRLCSVCGAINDSLALSDRRWTCACGVAHDRDVNAAINLERMAAGSAVTACGEEGSGRQPVLVAVKPASVKQEPSAASAG